MLWRWKLRQRYVTYRVNIKELLDEDKGRAARYGLDGKVIYLGK